MYALLIVCLIGQGDYQPIPPPPLPSSTIPPNAPPEPYRPPYNSERDWLTNNLIVDHPALEKQIKYKMSTLSDEQVHQLADAYRKQVAIAQAQLRQAVEYRNHVRQEIQDRVRAEEQRITAYGSALAQQQFNLALQQFYQQQYQPYGYGYGYGYSIPYSPKYYRPYRPYVSGHVSNYGHYHHRYHR